MISQVCRYRYLTHKLRLKRTLNHGNNGFVCIVWEKIMDEIYEINYEGPFQMGTMRDTLTEGGEGALHLGIPKDIYTLINHFTDAKDIWDNVKMILEGETIHVYYVRFTKLINDMRNIKMTMPRMQLNSKFVNNMLPEWSRFITEVKLNRGLKESNFDQLCPNASNQKYPTKSYAYPTILNQPSIADNFQLDTGSMSTDNLIESLTNTLTFLNQSFKAHLPQMNNQLRTSSNARNNATVQDDKVVVQDVRGRYNENNQDYFKDKMLLMQAQENGAVLDEEQLLFFAGEHVPPLDHDMDNMDEYHEVIEMQNDGVQSMSVNKKDKVAPDFNSFFKIKNLEHQIQEKDNVIRDLKVLVSNVNDRSCETYNAKCVFTAALISKQNECVRVELEKVKHYYKESYESIQITRAHTSEKTSTMLNEIESLKAQLKSKVSCVTSDSIKPKVLAPGMYAIDVKPIPPPLKNNRSAHLNYINHLKESVETVREIIEEARVVKPLDNALNYACQYTKLSQELLEYVWKATGKVFANVGYQWRPTGKKFTLGTHIGGHQWRPTGKMFILGEQCPLTRVLVKCRTDRPLVSGLRLFKTYDGESFKAQEVCGKVPREKWLQIGKGNLLLDLQKLQKNPIFRILVDIRQNINFVRAFTTSANVPSIYIQLFWNTLTHDAKTRVYSFQVNEHWLALSADLLWKALDVTPADSARPFESPPAGKTGMYFVNELGYPEPIHFVSKIHVNNHYHPWRAISFLFNWCFTGTRYI
ncbi:hypothetical protein Tco_1144489 [Tanacetum coccineum]